ncbi:MAG: hypothetical protein N2376_12910 [Clostridia bacterium]|nr:hypothetical protein [Clostridia bacterium]
MQTDPPAVSDIIKSFEANGEHFDYKLSPSRPDPYLSPLEWSPDSTRLLIGYQWYDDQMRVQSGSFVYEPLTNSVSRLTQNAPSEADHVPAVKPDGFTW